MSPHLSLPTRQVRAPSFDAFREAMDAEIYRIWPAGIGAGAQRGQWVGSQVVNKFQELVRLAQEAYINPFDLTRVRSLPCAVVADVLPLSQHAHCTSALPQASNNVLGPHL